MFPTLTINGLTQQQQMTAPNIALSGESFSINEWAIFPDTLRIENGSESIKLEPKVMQVLVYLANHAGEVITRQALEEDVWAGTIVGYDSITQTVTKLRKAFGDTPKQPRYIETIPKTGYRLIAEVSYPQTTSTSATPEPESTTERKPAVATNATIDNTFTTHSPFPPARIIVLLMVIILAVLLSYLWSAQEPEPALALPDKPSIAVMPFLNTSNDPAQTYFSDGITEDLITGLSYISGLFVIARNSSFRYKGQAIDVKTVADELGVRYILQGSVRKNKNQVRINVQLMDSATNTNAWAERYDRRLDDVFAIQDEVTHRIISALSVQLNEPDQRLPEQYDTRNVASYDEFLKGWQYYWKFSRDDFAQAEAHFKRALEIDPDNSRAHAGLALIYWQAWQQKWHENLGNVHTGWRRASHELEQAMRNPTPLAHSTHSAMLLINRRYEEAITEAEKAINMNRNHAMGYLALAEALSFSGQPGRAIETARKGMRLDPNFGTPYLLVIGRSQFDIGLYDEAVSSLQRALEFSPRDRNTLIVLIASLGQSGNIKVAETAFATLEQEHKAQKLRPFTIDWMTNRWPYRRKADRDHLLQGLEKAGITRW